MGIILQVQMFTPPVHITQAHLSVVSFKSVNKEINDPPLDASL